MLNDYKFAQIKLNKEFQNEEEALKVFENLRKQVGRIIKKENQEHYIVALGLSYCDLNSYKLTYKKNKYNASRRFIAKNKQIKKQDKKYHLNIFYSSNHDVNLSKKIIDYLKQRFPDAIVRRNNNVSEDKVLKQILLSKPTIVLEAYRKRNFKDELYKKMYQAEKRALKRKSSQEILADKLMKSFRDASKNMRQGRSLNKEEANCLKKLLFFERKDLGKILVGKKDLSDLDKQNLSKIRMKNEDLSQYIKVLVRKKKIKTKKPVRFVYFCFYKGTLEEFKKLPLHSFKQLRYAEKVADEESKEELKTLINLAFGL